MREFIGSRETNLHQKLRRDNTSGARGIYKENRKLRKSWRSTIGVRGKTIRLGLYKTKKEAIEARNRYIVENNLVHEYDLQDPNV
jgi:hypothetical protein